MFTVIDKTTGKAPELEQIVLAAQKAKEEWAKGLVHCDIVGFGVLEDDTLIVCDDCGNYAFPPAHRFEIRAAADGK